MAKDEQNADLPVELEALQKQLEELDARNLELEQLAAQRGVKLSCANIALSRPTGNHSHYRSSKHIGITHEEIMEVIIQVGAYTGWPCMAHAVHQYGEVLKEDAEASGAGN